MVWYLELVAMRRLMGFTTNLLGLNFPSDSYPACDGRVFLFPAVARRLPATGVVAGFFHAVALCRLSTDCALKLTETMHQGDSVAG